MAFLEFVTNNLYLYLAIIIALIILDIILTIICINQRKRQNIKEEFNEIENVDETEVNSEVAFELEKVLEQMQHDIEMKPEEVVKKFEEEQEQKAIISYQELVDSVNNNKIDVIDDEEGTIDYVQALEKEELNKETLETFNDNHNNVIVEDVSDDIKNKSHLDVIDELNSDKQVKRFKNSEILSPVFGRMQPDFEYHTINSFANTNNKVEIEQVAGDTKEDEIKKNEDFLKSLIDFRNNL